jgi:TPR repeat protein
MIPGKIRMETPPARLPIPGLLGRPFRVILLATAILALFVTSSFSADGTALRSQAEAGDATAQYNLGVMYGKGVDVPQDDAEAVKWYRKAAEQGNVEAQLILGAIYGKGRGVPQDDVESARWVRMAAEQGSAKAQMILGFMYGKGRGVPQDDAESARWVRMAAEQGDAKAQSFLGFLYGNGLGVPQDYAQSYFWSSLSASSGGSGSGKEYRDALETRDRVAKELTPVKIMEVQAMTREWEKTHPR